MGIQLSLFLSSCFCFIREGKEIIPIVLWLKKIYNEIKEEISTPGNLNLYLFPVLASNTAKSHSSFYFLQHSFGFKIKDWP